MTIKKISALIALLIFIQGATACTNKKDSDQEIIDEQNNLSGKIIQNVDDLKPSVIEEVVLVVEGSVNTYEDSIQINSGDTVYDVLKKSSDLNKFGLVVKDYDFGKSIDGIGDDLAGTDNKYWLYYLNGEMAMQSVDNQEVKSNDKIEFKFEKSTF